MTDTPRTDDGKAEANVTRFEVIDHTGRIADKVGRILSMHDVSIELSYQDDGRTLKVFVTQRIYKNPNCTIDHPGQSCNVACGYQ